MSSDKLRILEKPKLNNSRMLIGFSGWMNGGNVSTGTVEWFINKYQARPFARIEPEGFYIYNFPGSMETSSLFRPYTRIQDGLIVSYETPTNAFYYDKGADLILFLGKEPHILWEAYSKCVFDLCGQFGVKEIYFIGSVTGLVPHTRQGKIFSSVSDHKLKEKIEKFGLAFSEYEGPASLITYLTACAHSNKIEMATLITTVPAYVHGSNPRCIEAVIRNLSNILGLQIELDDLRHLSDEFERKLNEAIENIPELAQTISRLEEIHDKDIIEHELGDLKEWLEQKGVSLD